MVLQCRNLECGWTGVASIIIERTIVQSAMADPRITLPIAITRRKSANAPTPAPANDDGLEVAAEAM